MARQPSTPSKPKISPEFARRLARLAPDAMARAIVVLDIGAVPPAEPGRSSKAERKTAAQAIQAAASVPLEEVDRLLERSGGRLLAARPHLFGSIPVEARASALLALAESKHIRALLEDQPLTALHHPAR
jgi:hypothetical protein